MHHQFGTGADDMAKKEERLFSFRLNDINATAEQMSRRKLVNQDYGLNSTFSCV